MVVLSKGKLVYKKRTVNMVISKNKKWIIFDILIATIIIVCVGFFLIYILSNLSRYFPINLINIFSTLISIMAGTCYLFLKYPIEIEHFGFDKKNFKKIILWGGIGALVILSYNFPYKIISGEKEIPQELFVETQQGILYIFLFLITVIIFIPFVEELFYRAFLFRIVKNNFDIFTGYAVSTAFFSIGHKFTIPSIINSLIFCYIYNKTGLIGTNIIAHIIFNFIWFLAVYWIVLVQ